MLRWRRHVAASTRRKSRPIGSDPFPAGVAAVDFSGEDTDWETTQAMRSFAYRGDMRWLRLPVRKRSSVPAVRFVRETGRRLESLLTLLNGG